MPSFKDALVDTINESPDTDQAVKTPKDTDQAAKTPNDTVKPPKKKKAKKQ